MNSNQHSDDAPVGELDVRVCTENPVDAKAVWQAVRDRAEEIEANEPGLRKLLDDVIFSQNDIAGAVGVRLARKLAREDMSREEVAPLLDKVLHDDPEMVESIARDLDAIVERDPACDSPIQPLLFYKGFLAISTYRISHHLWTNDRRDLALYFQSLASEVFGVDIHPAARIGCGILLDHATSFVVGETAVIEDNVSILHEVTLGGTGKQSGDRHPIVRSGVLLGAGAKILGRVEIGEGAKVGAGSVVLNDVPPHCTVAGVPAQLVGENSEFSPALEMNQSIQCRKKKP